LCCQGTSPTGIKNLLSVYKDAEDLINIGAYVKGSNKGIDRAIDKIDLINSYLRQEVNEKIEFEEVLDAMKNIVS
jgi:flagellum-specific ATP synthase